MWVSAMKPYLVEKPFMAKVIEFYVPKNFRTSRKHATDVRFGRVIQFRLPAKKSA